MTVHLGNYLDNSQLSANS